MLILKTGNNSTACSFSYIAAAAVITSVLKLTINATKILKKNTPGLES